MLERRNGLTRGIFNRFHESSRFADRATLDEERNCLDAILNHGGFSVYRMVFGPNPANFYPSRNTSISSHFMIQWKSRHMGRKDMSKEMAAIKLRRDL